MPFLSWKINQDSVGMFDNKSVETIVVLIKVCKM